MDIIETLETRNDKSVKQEGQEFVSRELSIVEDEDGSAGSEETKLASTTRILESRIDGSDSPLQYEMISDGDGSNISPRSYRVVQFSDVEDLPAVTVQNVQQSPQSVQTFYSNPINGGIFVIGSSHDVFPIGNSQKAVVARSLVEENTRPTVTRDDKRRATHNEVERRRRDKINHWIMKLGKIIPECKYDSAKGSFESQSKGGILAKACDYISELKETNIRLLMYAKENEQLLADIENLNQQHERLSSENVRLKALLRQQGITSFENTP